MAKRPGRKVKRVVRREWSAQDERQLRKHSKSKNSRQRYFESAEAHPGSLAAKGA